MSPEVIEGNEADARADIFSLGIVLFEMTTGRRPFGGETPLAAITAILRDTPPLASDLNERVPQELALNDLSVPRQTAVRSPAVDCRPARRSGGSRQTSRRRRVRHILQSARMPAGRSHSTRTGRRGPPRDSRRRSGWSCWGFRRCIRRHSRGVLRRSRRAVRHRFAAKPSIGARLQLQRGDIGGRRRCRVYPAPRSGVAPAAERSRRISARGL